MANFCEIGRPKASAFYMLIIGPSNSLERPGRSGLAGAQNATSEIDGTAALFPVAIPGRVKAAAPAEFLRRLGRWFGLGLFGGGRFIGFVGFRLSHGDSSSP